MKTSQYSLYLFLILMISACSTTSNTAVLPYSWESLQATLWVQHAAEYDALALGHYRSAENNIDELLQDSTYSAIPGQSIKSGDKEPAIIMDVDETILDNSPFQARLIRNKSEFTPDLWAQWVNEENASSVPGSIDFTRKASQKGVTIFYLTNRDHSLERATLNNLKELGFPIDKIDSSKRLTDVILTNGEYKDWTSSKIERRKEITDNFRVIMMFGDNLNDFVPAKGETEKQRLELLDQYREYFGHSWFMLPNPVYGSWEDSMMKPYEKDTERNKIINNKIELLVPKY